MAPLLSIASAALLLSGAQAHFLLNSPPPLGPFLDDDEGNAPCGGYTPDFTKQTVSNFSVGGDSIATQSTHPQTHFLYRITTDQTAASNWSQIYPIFQQSGLGSFCASQVTVPESYVGQSGVLSVVADGPDGLLYQCTLVNFIAGTNTTKPSSCTNSTTVTASFDADTSLTAVLSGTSTNTSTTTSPSASSTKNAATAAYGSSLGGVQTLATVAIMAAVGALLI